MSERTLRAGSVRSTTRATGRYIGPPRCRIILTRRCGVRRPASDACQRQAGQNDAGENRYEETEARRLRDAERAHGPEPEAEGDDEGKERREDGDRPR